MTAPATRDRGYGAAERHATAAGCADLHAHLRALGIEPETWSALTTAGRLAVELAATPRRVIQGRAA